MAGEAGSWQLSAIIEGHCAALSENAALCSILCFKLLKVPLHQFFPVKRYKAVIGTRG